MNLGELWKKASVVTAGTDKSEWKPFKNIIDFFRSCKGIELTAQQKFIYKCVYGLELDNSTRDLILYDQYVEKVTHEFTELDFFHYLKDQGRINQESPEAMIGRTFSPIILIIGRRGSKSFLTAGVQAYETARLLSKYSPHEYYNIIPGEKIWLKSIAPTGGQSQIIFDFARAIMLSNDFFVPFWNKDIAGYMALNSRFELDQVAAGKRGFANPKGSICMTFESSVSRHLRGPGLLVFSLDEVAHFVLATNSITSDEQVYQALAPSIATFKDKQGRQDGKAFLITSPLNQAGLAYSEYIRSFEDRENSLMIQIPSWEANPTRLTSSLLRTEFKKNEEIFSTEYGAEFSKTLNVYAEMSWLERDFNREEKRSEVGKNGVWYYLGTDLGHKHDATAFVIVHLDWDGNVILDYVESWDPEVTGIENNADAIKDHIRSLYKKFTIKKGILDQFNGWAIRDTLRKEGIHTMELINVTEGWKSQCFTATKDYLRNGKIQGYWDDSLCMELLRLREIRKSEYVIHVNKFGSFKDDIADAFVRAVWMAIEASMQGQRGREIRGEAQEIQIMKTRRHRRVFTPGVTNRFGVRRR